MTRLKDCVVCTAYRRRRAHVLAPAIALRAFIRGVHPPVVAVEYMFAVHRRHLAGHTLSTRSSTPHEDLGDGHRVLHVKRVCNGCGKELGDATADELEAAVDGDLPDVRIECGCYDQEAAA